MDFNSPNHSNFFPLDIPFQVQRSFEGVTTSGWQYGIREEPITPDKQKNGGSRPYRAVWISDIHLGSKLCQAEMLLEFLKDTKTETLYIVGDFIDGWRLRKRWYWKDVYYGIFRQVLKMAEQGTRVVYVPGNHDVSFRPFCGLELGKIEIQSHVVHHTVRGQKYLVIHGDQFDGTVSLARLFCYLGDKGYELLMEINSLLNWARRKMGKPYWSFTSFIKSKVKKAVKYIDSYEKAASEYARNHGYDGIICGHIHQPKCRNIDGVNYYNTGDWVENCTALVEEAQGQMSLIDTKVQSRGSMETRVEVPLGT